MIGRIFDSGAMPALERLVQFTGQRHRVLADSIANLSTPNYRPRDLDPAQFQAAMQDAIERRRSTTRPMSGELKIDDTRQLRFHNGGIEAKPQPTDENILFHDRNNRSLERIMQDVAENTLTHDAGITLLKNEFEMLKLAIRERI
ncbi:MAG: flagellar basal body rod protein FlgB [Phycisphaeraceae bacterium]